MADDCTSVTFCFASMLSGACSAKRFVTAFAVFRVVAAYFPTALRAAGKGRPGTLGHPAGWRFKPRDRNHYIVSDVHCLRSILSVGQPSNTRRAACHVYQCAAVLKLALLDVVLVLAPTEPRRSYKKPKMHGLQEEDEIEKPPGTSSGRPRVHALRRARGSLGRCTGNVVFRRVEGYLQRA